jgi:hypothetical protein
MSVPTHVFGFLPAAWRTSRIHIPICVNIGRVCHCKVRTTASCLVQDAMSTLGQVDWRKHKLWHRGMDYFVLLVETFNFALVRGEDDIIVVKARLGDHS